MTDQRLWLYNGAPLVAFYDTLGIRRTYSRLKPPASWRGQNAYELTKVDCRVWVYWCFTSRYLLVFYVTIFQSYMWRHICAGGLKKKLYLRSGSQRQRHFTGFFNVPVLHRHGTTLCTQPFLKGYFRGTATMKYRKSTTIWKYNCCTLFCSTIFLLLFGSTIFVLYFAVHFLYFEFVVQLLYYNLICCTTFVPSFWSTVFIQLADSTIFIQFLRSVFLLPSFKYNYSTAFKFAYFHSFFFRVYCFICRIQ